jgi:predicted Zn-dependent peptidase
VRDRQVAAEATAFTYDLTKGADLLVVDVTARPGISPEMLEQEVAREVDVVFRDGVTAGEVARAIALIESDLVRAMQSAGDRADRLSMYATYFGKPELINELPDRYRAVTVKEVNRFIKSHLGENNRASLLFVPRDMGPADEQVAAAASAAS